MTQENIAAETVEQPETETRTEGPRITQEQIEDLMDRVVLTGTVIDGTTSTVLHAFLDGKFYLGTGHSACVSPENFDPQLGFDIARRKLTNIVEEKLWELEGYRLYRELNP